MSLWVQTQIDGIAMTLAIPSKILHKYLYGQLVAMVKHQKDLFPDGKVTFAPGAYTSRFTFYGKYSKIHSLRRQIAQVEYGAVGLAGKNIPHRYIRLELHPSKMREGEFSNFTACMDTMLTEISYADFFNSANVSYLELARDSLQYGIESFLPYRKHCSDSKVFKKGDEDPDYRGSIRIGSENSRCHFRIYDKAKELEETGKTKQFNVSHHVRIECVGRYLGMSAAKLAEHPNLFSKLRIADRKTLDTYENDPEWEGFLLASDDDGAPRASAQFPHRRKEFNSRLDAAQVPWWSPENAWNSFLKVRAHMGPN